MNYNNGIVLIKGQDKTKDIDYIREAGNSCYVKFYGDKPPYCYARENVLRIRKFSVIDITYSRVYIKGLPELNAVGLKRGVNGNVAYYIVRIIRKDKTTNEDVCVESAFIEKDIEVRKSCLEGDSLKLFEYLRRCAALSPVGKDKNNVCSKGILENIYSRLNYIDPDSVASIYFNPVCNLKTGKVESIIFPFGTNKSQEAAIREALGNRISVIHGPPGTGKTQTILNIVANLIRQRKTVLIVSGNNSATANVREKLGKYALDFIVAPLGNRKNKEAFIASQPLIPDCLSSWKANERALSDTLADRCKHLSDIFRLQEDIATWRIHLSDIQLEKSHYLKEVMEKTSNVNLSIKISSHRLHKKIQKLNRYAEVTSEDYPHGRWRPWTSILRFITRLQCGSLLNQRWKTTTDMLHKIISEHELLFYAIQEEELGNKIAIAEKKLADINAESIISDITRLSLRLLKSHLAVHFQHGRETLNEVGDIWRKGKDFLKDYPVVLSTTFSSRSCMGEYPLFDYVIMDEASQVSIETGVLALTCAHNAVIVGDTRQLPNVVKAEDKVRLRHIEQALRNLNTDFNVPPCYNCADNSFLSSVADVVPSLSITLLREHYRCHPDIINFCNRRFYNGELLIMTRKNDNDIPLSIITSSIGKHMIRKYNQREIDIITKECLPKLGNQHDIGIIAPYNNQVNQIKAQHEELDVATVHKFQGREKDVIIFSVTDDKISEFADNANLLNVAVSRARDKFCLIVSGNKQERHGNIHDLMQYIRYCNGEIRESGLNSIFDNLEAVKFSRDECDKRISNKAEFVTYGLIKEVLKEYSDRHNLGCIPHYALRKLISDFSILDEEERKYTRHPGTHLDFIIYDKLTKEALMAVETDGYTYHNKHTKQHDRDLKKDRILIKYGLPIVRLVTNSCEEHTKIIKTLEKLLKNEANHSHGSVLHLIDEE